MIRMDSPVAVRAAAGLFSGLVSSGHTPPVGMFRALISAARGFGMMTDPTVLAAGKWQDWLHPRGKDGRFIEKDAFVNIFGDEHALLSDRSAVRRRAKINTLRPEGAHVTYYDMLNPNPDGSLKKLPADPAAGFPETIPVEQLSTKVAMAPKAVAQLKPRSSAQEEFDASHEPALTQQEFDFELGGLNQSIKGMNPEQVAVVSTGQDALPNEEFGAHAKFLHQINELVTGHGLTYDAAFKDNYGLWSEPMQEMFDSLVDEVFQTLTANESKPKDRRAILLGGMPGAGKSTTLDRMADNKAFRGEEWIIVNPDHFKDRMLERGLFPKVAGLTPAETANFIHEASSEMNHMLEQLLMVDGYNIIFDITMGGDARTDGKSWNEKLVDVLRSQSYDDDIDGILVGVDPLTSRTRVAKRHLAGLNAYRTGADEDGNTDSSEVKFGGRAVPESVIARSEFPEGDPDAETYKSQNERNFRALVGGGTFSRWAMWDNTGAEPVFIAGSASDVTDRTNMPGYYPAAPSAPAAGPGGEAVAL